MRQDDVVDLFRPQLVSLGIEDDAQLVDLDAGKVGAGSRHPLVAVTRLIGEREKAIDTLLNPKQEAIDIDLARGPGPVTPASQLEMSAASKVNSPPPSRRMRKVPPAKPVKADPSTCGAGLPVGDVESIPHRAPEPGNRSRTNPSSMA